MTKIVAISRGMSFLEWWQIQTEFKRTDKNVKETQNAHWQHLLASYATLQSKNRKTLIVTDRNGWPVDGQKCKLFQLHKTEAEAAKYGQTHLGKRNFIILQYSKFQQTYPYRFLNLKWKFQQKQNQFKDTAEKMPAVVLKRRDLEIKLKKLEHEIQTTKTVVPQAKHKQLRNLRKQLQTLEK